MATRQLRLRTDGLAVVAVLAVTALAAWRQAGGFTKSVLFFDDAWAALPAHESFATALKMSVSTPGWTMGLWGWIRAGSYASSWAQLPSYLFALAVPISLYALLRWMKFQPVSALAGAVVVALNPTTIIYATRVKPYTMEMVLAIVLLAVAEWVRREPSTKRLVGLGVASFVAFTASFATVSVIVASWLAVLWLSQRSTRRRVVIAGALSALGALAVGVPYLIARPATLGDNWISRGFMADWSSFRGLIHNLTDMTAGFAHFFTGVPVDRRFLSAHVNTQTRIVALLCVVALVSVLVVTLRSASRRAHGEVVAASLTLLVALLLGLLDVLPFGDGRTDEVLYPAIGILVAAGVRSLMSHLNAQRVVVGALVLATVATLGVVNVVRTPALYPQAGLAALFHKIEPDLQPGDVLVVPPYLSFSWAEAQLTSWRVDLHPVSKWPQGFRVASRDALVILPATWKGSDPQLWHLEGHHTVWYIGYTLGVWNPYAPTKKIPAGVPMFTYTRQELQFRGWRTSFIPTYGHNVYAEPLSHP